MGVTCLTRGAVVSGSPLTALQRARVLKAALHHGLFGRTVAAFVIESKSLEELAQIGLVGNIVASAGTPGLRQIDEAPPGRWLVDAIAALASEDVLVCSDGTAWNGKTLGEGGFSLLDLKTKIGVEATDESTGESTDVSRFYDVMTISGHGAPLAAEFAKSTFIENLEKVLGLRITCSSYEY